MFDRQNFVADSAYNQSQLAVLWIRGSYASVPQTTLFEQITRDWNSTTAISNKKWDGFPTCNLAFSTTRDWKMKMTGGELKWKDLLSTRLFIRRGRFVLFYFTSCAWSYRKALPNTESDRCHTGEKYHHWVKKKKKNMSVILALP